MLGDELREELRQLIRFEVDDVIGRHIRAAFGNLLTEGLEPIVAGVAELLNDRRRLETMEESLGLLVESQTRVERAVADATDQTDADEPWRASLDDVSLDDSDD